VKVFIPSQLNGKRAPGRSMDRPVQPRCPRNGTADDDASRELRQRRRSHHWRREPSGRSPTSLRQPGYRPASGPSLVLGPCRMRPRGSGCLPLAGTFAMTCHLEAPRPSRQRPGRIAFAFRFTSFMCLAMSIDVAVAAERSLAPVVVTATREPEAIGRSTADVVVIDADTIRNTAADSVEDLLRRVAGLQIVRNGGPGQNSGFFIRGASTNSTVVLVDGVRVACTAPTRAAASSRSSRAAAREHRAGARRPRPAATTPTAATSARAVRSTPGTTRSRSAATRAAA
jgi:hypothetical protein